MTRTKAILAAVLLAAPAQAAPGGQRPDPVQHIKSCNAVGYYRDLFVSLGMGRNAIAHLDCAFYSRPN